MKKRISIFWLIMALLIIAYPIYFLIYGLTYTPDPDAFISMNGEGLALLLAIIFALPFLGVLSIAVLVREIVLYARRKTSLKRFVTVSSITIVIVIGAVIFLCFT